MKNKLIQAILEHLNAGNGFNSIIELRGFAAGETGQVFKPGTPEAKLVEEAFEAAIVRAARRVVQLGRNLPPAEVYDRLLELYSRQPNLSTRTSHSTLLQQYSTPVPIAYLVSVLAEIDDSCSIYEPTAGHGSLLIASNPLGVWANELDVDRATDLKDQGYPRVSTLDALNHSTIPMVQVNRVVVNPPFGKIPSGIDWVDAPNLFSTKRIDYAIAWNSLRAMKADTGKAVLILASERIRSEEERSKAYNGLEERRFFKRLYDNYNVTDHFTIDGDLYSKQGASFPIDLIVIDGVGNTDRPLPAAELPRVYRSYEDLRELLPKTAPDPGFTFWFSGIKDPREIETLNAAGVKHVLMNPFQFKKLRSLIPPDWTFVLDSPAYAVFKGRKELETDEHIAIINEAHSIAKGPKCAFVVPADAVGDMDKTLENWDKVKHLIYPWMPVWQWGADIRILEDLLCQAPVVGVGGLVMSLRSRDKAVLNELIILCKRFPRRLHLFGLCWMRALQELKDYAYSADSSSWITGRSGEIICINANGDLTKKKAAKIGLQHATHRDRNIQSAQTLLRYVSGETTRSPQPSEVEQKIDPMKDAILNLLRKSEVLQNLTFEEARQYLVVLEGL